MSGRKSRNKGATGERELANLLRDTWPTRRGYQRRSGSDECDVEGTPYWVEAKRVKKQERVRAAMKQAQGDTDGRPPVVFSRPDGDEWLVTMTLADWLRLVK